MKKTLLFFCGVGIVLGTSAQNKRSIYKARVPNPRQHLVEGKAPSKDAYVSPQVMRMHTNPITNSSFTDVATGGGANSVFGMLSPVGRNLIDYNPALNTVTFTHRSCTGTCVPLDSSSSSGYIWFDYSKNGGVTWAGEKGYIYNGGGINLPIRYPEGFIVNPAGNTNADSAYIESDATALSAAWDGFAHSTAQIGKPFPNCQAEDVNPATYAYNVNDAAIMTANNTIWESSIAQDTAQLEYLDSIIVRKGTWSASTKCMTWTVKAVPFPMVFSQSLEDALGYYGGLYNTSTIAFSSNGMTGYLAVDACGNTTFAPDSSYYVTVLKTTDGGVTWGTPYQISMDVNAQMGTTGVGYSAGWQIDGAVDANGKLHLILGIAPSAGTGNIDFTPGTWGEFSIVTDGTTDTKTLLHKPETAGGAFNTDPSVADPTDNVVEYNRGQIAINLAGDKVYYVWFDTDTTFASLDTSMQGNYNVNPDAWVKAYDVTATTWGPATNLTAGSVTQQDGGCTFGSVAYYTGACSGGDQLEIAYTKLNNEKSDVPVTIHYLSGMCVTAVNEVNDVFDIANAYPNPTSGQTTIEVDLKQNTSITVTIANLIGQTVYTTTANNLSEGKHLFNVDASKFSSGVYFYTVKSKDFQITKKLVRE